MRIDVSDKFLNARFSINCPSIEVKKSKTAKSSKGNGKIIRSSDGTLKVQFNAVSESQTIKDCFQKFSVPENETRGKLLSEEDYYSLSAVDEDGRNWQTEKALIQSTKVSKKTRLSISISEISCTSESCIAHKEESMLIKLENVVKLPFLWDMKSKTSAPPIHTFEVGDKLILFQRNQTLFLSKEVGLKLREAFQFLLAQHIEWSCYRLTSTNKTEVMLHSHSVKRVFTVGTPPICLDSIYAGKEKEVFPDAATPMCSERQLWRLYESYFNYLSSSSEYGIHPMSGWVNRVIESTQQNLEARMLTISVAVESIIDLKEFDFLTSDNSQRASQRDSLIQDVERLEEWMSEQNLDDSFRKRLKGFLGSLSRKSIRPIDKLYKLVDIEVLDKDHVESWKNLRNASAHGYVVSPGNVESHYQKYQNVAVLFFQLIFFLIEYQGVYSDYSEIRYPLRYFEKTV